MSGITTLGIGPTARTTWLTREARRTNLEFLTAATLKAGQPVKLNTAGAIVAWAQADGPQKLIGYCLYNSTSGDLATIMTRGMGVIFAIATSGGVVTGLGGYLSYDSSTAVDNLGSGQPATATGYSVYGNVIDADILTKPHGWILDVAAAGVITRVLLAN